MKVLFSIFVAICLSSSFYGCQSSSARLGMAEAYFPKAQLLQEGIVNKYYLHYKSADDDEVATNIEYQKLLLTAPDELEINYFDAGYELNKTRRFKFQEDQMALIQEQEYFRADTFKFTLSSSPCLHWKGGNAESEKTVTRQNRTQHLKRTQQSIRDTLILNRPAKIIEGTLKSIVDTLVMDYRISEIFVQDMGLFEQVIKWPGGFSRLELVEQIPVQTFQKLRASAEKRIGYIDPEKVLFGAENFQPCDRDFIIDYYNGDPDAAYTGGKRALWQSILPQLDTTALDSESGYLTFRFIVNCKGEAGWFVLEQTSLDYRKKTFDAATIRHLSDIVTTLKTWQPAMLRGQAFDAYTYLTFKLKDGEIVDLLP